MNIQQQPSYSSVFPLILCSAFMSAFLLTFSASTALADTRECRAAKVLVVQAGKHPEDQAESLRLYGKAVELCPKFRQAQYNLGVLQFQQGKFEDAKKSLEQAKALGDDSAVNAALGAVSAKLGDAKGSVDYYQKAKTQSPDNPEVMEGLGAALQNSGDSDAAAEVLEESADRQETLSPRAMYNRGVVARDQGKIEDAIASFAAAEKGDASCYECAYELGKMWLKKGNNSEAEKALLRAVALKPNAKDPLLMLADLYQQQTRSVDHENILKKLTAADPNDADAYYRLGALYLNQKRFDLAASALQKSSALDPNNQKALANLGWAQMELKDFKGAEEVLKRSAAINSKDAATQNNLGVLYQQSGKLDEAAKAYRAAVESDPNMKTAKDNLANIEAADKNKADKGK